MADKLNDTGRNTIAAADYIKLTRELVASQREIDRTTTAAAAARGVKAGILKRAVNLGADKDVMIALAEFAQMDPTERADFFGTLGMYAGWTGISLWKAGDSADPQGSMFDEAAKEEFSKLSDAQAYENGRKAGVAAGDLEENPHLAGSSLHQQWVTGYYDGQADNAPAKAEGIEAVAPRRRGRPAKAAAVH